MNRKNIMKKNKSFKVSIFCTIIEGILSSFNGMIIYFILRLLWNKELDNLKLVQYTLFLTAIFILRLIIYSYGYIQGQIGGAEISKKIRLFLGDKLRKIPIPRFSKSQTGCYINAVTFNVNDYENILTHKTGELVKNITLVIMLTIFVCYLNFTSGIILFAVGILIIPTLYISISKVRKYGNEKSEISSQNVSSIIEYIAGIQTFRAYKMGGVKHEKLTQIMKKFSDISYIYELKIIPVGVIYNIISGLSMPVIIWIVGKQWILGNIDTVSYLTVSMLPLFLVKLLGTIFVNFTSYKNLLISKNKIKKLIEEKEELQSDEDFKPKNNNIEFENVSFYYDEEEPLFCNLNLEIGSDKFTAIIGDSGSGKSTIINLIAKYYEPQLGKIKIGGIAINKIGADKILSYISMVDQDVFLFDDTIINNIRYANQGASIEEVKMACKAAQCDDFIRNLPQGYETRIGENGNFLSGGERQRLSIARAILKNSSMLLLDEATSNLDVENELKVKSAIRNLLSSKKTVVMIAHSLSVIKQADLIIILSRGKVIAQGTHEQLMKQSKKYISMLEAECGIS
ncbi:MAG: ABC transporter ATP-binding protein/permease [Clostridium sp.]|jgi:ATP-binding cassette subfamily B protein|uniref:ABC transporter ATP-binding protein n=1 Tax=Clostridium sp. TaxID=1506 RepID=UPI0025BC35F3|nr:ABC transporter ATP-binding protein [Clostridium sp.]MCH3963503.1 ABC transporter ATP-binding protein/permease [Clostridium sp.]MCI1714644.1 ABC transporter ATP-binding protein/permease [Clostridium sp.]MCI1799167.1 ABC transporter ATP-binding protein/permease [Clostridium sp.]MCI1812827.1 ABC transporter ATP-binding protein/permease [Clostridium sp.]MCI1869717.1 ABC transporter ATP-binding protein/permease [Clostridium sp.]